MKNSQTAPKLLVLLLFGLLHPLVGAQTFPGDEGSCGVGPKDRLGRDIPETCFVTQEDDRYRCYYTYVPDCAEGPTPILFSNHGLSACPSDAETVNEWTKKADEECIIIVYPKVCHVDLLLSTRLVISHRRCVSTLLTGQHTRRRWS